MNVPIDIHGLRKSGWMRINAAVPIALCHRLLNVLESELSVPLNDPPRWDTYGGEMRDLVPVWGHQAQWDIRQYPSLHQIWAGCGVAKSYACRWIHDGSRHHGNQATLNQEQFIGITIPGARKGECSKAYWRSLIQRPIKVDFAASRLFTAWPRRPVIHADGEENWLADTSERDIVHVPAKAGDLIVWDSRLAHSNSKNRSSRPRVAFYVLMGPSDDQLRHTAVESWRTGRCVPWWRGRPGYDRIEPWPPATLTELGRKLLGLDSWS